MAGFMRLTVWAEEGLAFNDAEAPRSETPDEVSELAESIGMRYWANYTAPGYMDRTDTCGPFTSALEAARECAELFGDLEEKGSPDRVELANVIREIRAARARAVS